MAARHVDIFLASRDGDVEKAARLEAEEKTAMARILADQARGGDDVLVRGVVCHWGELSLLVGRETARSG